MPATILDETGHRGETEYEFQLLAEYFEVSETAINEIERSETKRLEEAHAEADDDTKVALAGRGVLGACTKIRARVSASTSVRIHDSTMQSVRDSCAGTVRGAG